jgi:hypothetical protein
MPKSKHYHHTLYHDKGTVRIAQVVRYIVTTSFSKATSEPHDSSPVDDKPVDKVFLRIRNCAQIFRRAQYLNGPYFIAVSVREAQFNSYDEITGKLNKTPPPHYDPEVKASQSFWAELEFDDRPYKWRLSWLTIIDEPGLSRSHHRLYLVLRRPVIGLQWATAKRVSVQRLIQTNSFHPQWA